MQGPNMKIILFIWPILEYHLGVIMVYTLIQQKNVIRWNGWFGLRNERNMNQYWLGNMTQIMFRFESRFGSKAGSKLKKWNSQYFPINGMWLSKISSSVSRSMCIGINVGSGIGSKSGKDTRININSKIEIEWQSWGSGSHSQSSSIFLKWKLANLSKVWDWSSSRYCSRI